MARPLFVLAKACMVLGWLTIVVQSYVLDLRWVTPGLTIPWLAIAVEGLGITVIALAFRDLGEANQMGLTQGPMRLRSTGIYRFSRNPMYLGFHLLTVASALYTLNPLVLAMGFVSMVVHHVIVLAEERHLTQRLGTEYAEYQRTVRRYV